MPEIRVQQILDQQMTGTDPFAIARQQSQAQAQVLPDAQLMGGGPFDDQAGPAPAFKAQQATPPVVDNSVGNVLMQPASGPASANFEKSSLPKTLQKMGIDDKGLALNDLGRIQLIGRLKKKFGEQYNQVPAALDVLSLFDETISKYPMDTQKKLNQSVSNAERTLKALLGGR